MGWKRPVFPSLKREAPDLLRAMFCGETFPPDWTRLRQTCSHASYAEPDGEAIHPSESVQAMSNAAIWTGRFC